MFFAGIIASDDCVSFSVLTSVAYGDYYYIIRRKVCKSLNVLICRPCLATPDKIAFYWT